jgi:hypothetical protein
MSDLTAYLFVVLGVFVAVLLPVLSAYIRKEFPATGAIGLPPWLKRYLLLFVFSLVVGLVSLAIWKSLNPQGELHWFTALLIGFGWESALEKFLHPKP